MGKEAQARGVEVLLSVGGGAESGGSPPDPAQFVEVLSNMYLTPRSDYTGPRPFGDVVLDGIDLDMEQEWGQMPGTWMPTFLERFPSAPLLTIAPQCFDFNTQYKGSITGVTAVTSPRLAQMRHWQVLNDPAVDCWDDYTYGW